jgi:adenylate cyclase
LQAFNNEILNLAFQIREPVAYETGLSSDDIIIIDIDDQSIEKLGRINNWPRLYDAEVIKHISQGNPKAIALDLLYTESDSMPQVYSEILEQRGFSNSKNIINNLSTDQLLSQAIRMAGNIYLPLFTDDAVEDSFVDYELISKLPLIKLPKAFTGSYYTINYPILPVDSFAKASKGIGSINIPSSSDGVVKDYPLFQKLALNVKGDKSKIYGVANFPVLMYMDANNISLDSIKFDINKIQIGNSLSVPVDENGKYRINWLGSANKFRYISFYKVLQKRVPSELFEDKYVFIGTSAAGLHDLKTTPVSIKIPGVEVHAVVFHNLMNHSFFIEKTNIELLPHLFIFALLLTFIYLSLKPLMSLIIVILLGLLEFFLFILYIFPIHSVVVPMESFLILTVFSYVIAFIFKYLTEEREKIMLKKAFASYVSPDVVNLIIEGSDKVNLNGEKKILTVLFSDIRGFTSISEKLNPQMVVSFLNYYLSFMTEVIFKNKGTIDKFMGDGIMVIYGAPVSQMDNAMRACYTALDMVSELSKINEYLKNQNQTPINIGIGINTGEMTVGNIGSNKKFDYTVIGDSVNLGSRIEGLNKIFGTRVLISESTREQIANDAFIIREIAQVKVQGKAQPVRIFEILDLFKNFIKYNELLHSYNKGLLFFRENKLIEAIKEFEDALIVVPDDGPSRYYLDASKQALNNDGLYSTVITMYDK